MANTRLSWLPRESARSLTRAAFAAPDQLLAAVKALRGEGLKVVDTFTPFPIHGLDEAMGARPSRLPWVTGILGLAGCLGAWLLQIWTSAHDYPLKIGGKPFVSTPAFIPVAFELTVLCAGLGTVVALLFRLGLFPGRRAKDLHPGVNDHRFVLVVQADSLWTGEKLADYLLELGACEAERLVRDQRRADCPRTWEREAGPASVLAGLVFLPLAVLAGGMALKRDFHHRNLEFDAGMLYPAAAQAYDANGVLGQVIQAPPEGTVAQGQQAPFPYGPGVEEATRAGAELVCPLPADPASMARGKMVFQRICATCHGAGAKGDGTVIPRFPNPPNLLIPKYQAYPIGRLFHVTTFGGPEKIMKGFADQLSADDRWRAVLYLRSIQAQAVPPAATQGAKP